MFEKGCSRARALLHSVQGGGEGHCGLHLIASIFADMLLKYMHLVVCISSENLIVLIRICLAHLIEYLKLLCRQQEHSVVSSLVNQIEVDTQSNLQHALINHMTTKLMFSAPNCSIGKALKALKALSPESYSVDEM